MNPENLRIGIGHDTHRLVPGGPLLLGGVRIEFDQHLSGHSDADVLLHAVTDALLGAAGMGDIGEMFPDHLAENKDRDSLEMLAIAFSEVKKRGYKLIHLDCIVFAERPKLSPYKMKMAESIGAATGVESGQVNVKAKTGEGIGSIGTGDCMMAQCVALLYRSDG